MDPHPKRSRDEEAEEGMKPEEVDFDEIFEIIMDEKNEAQPPKKKLKTASHSGEIFQSRLPPVVVERNRKPFPNRLANGNLVFRDFPEFQPNLTPKEIFQAGSFGGCYFQPMTSRITGVTYSEAWKEFPSDWFSGLSIEDSVASEVYRNDINFYKVACGSSVKEWEESDWVTDADPYGWFQWYCRFFLGRRCSDDHRQINRALGVMGANGRWRKNLMNKCLGSGKTPEEAVNDFTISPKIRQLLQQWGYKLTLDDLNAFARSKSASKK